MPLVLLLLLTLFLVAPSAGPRQAASAPPAAQAAPAARVDADRQMRDLQALSDPALEGRLTGSPGSRRAQTIIVERFKALGLEPVDGSYTAKFSFTGKGRGGQRAFPDATNLAAMVVGRREPKRYVIVSAHYDHLGAPAGRTHPGADDNASGVAAMLAIAGWFAAHPPDRSILFLAFDGEEQGLQGAKQFVSKPPVPLDRVVAIVNMDMIGRGDANTLFVAGTHHSPALAPLVTEAAKGRPLTLKLGHDKPAALANGQDDWTNSSDHGPFHQAGVPFLYFGVEDHSDYHKPTDTADKIPRPFYIAATELVLETVIRLAEAAP